MTFEYSEFKFYVIFIFNFYEFSDQSSSNSFRTLSLKENPFHDSNYDQLDTKRLETNDNDGSGSNKNNILEANFTEAEEFPGPFTIHMPVSLDFHFMAVDKIKIIIHLCWT